MLEERVVALARKTADPQLKDLDAPLELSAATIRAKWHGHGHLHLYLMQRYVQEVGQRAQVIWRNVHRAHTTLGAPRLGDLRADLFEEFRTELDATMTVLRPRFDRDMKDAPKSTKSPTFVDQLEMAVRHEFARYEAEIDHYASALDAAIARGIPPAPSYVIHGNVGAVVTGPGAIANVVQNIGTEQRDALLKALDVVKQTLIAAPELRERDRSELLELADEAAAELAKEHPNTRRLSLTLQSLAAAVQGIASAPVAYEVLRAAALAIGI